MYLHQLAQGGQVYEAPVVGPCGQAGLHDLHAGLPQNVKNYSIPGLSAIVQSLGLRPSTCKGIWYTHSCQQPGLSTFAARSVRATAMPGTEADVVHGAAG